MAGIPQKSSVIGGELSFQDSTALAAYDVSGTALGTTAYNVAVGASFILQLSSASLVPDQVVAVAGVSGARWIKLVQVTGADQANLSGLVGLSGWYLTQYQRIVAIDPSINTFRVIQLTPSSFTSSSVPAYDAGVTGGAVYAQGGPRYFGLGAVANVKSDHWAIAGRSSIGTVPATSYSAFGLMTSNGSAELIASAKTGDDATHYCLRWDGFTGTPVVAATSVVASTSYHDIVIVGDTANVTLQFDGVFAASHAIDATLADSTLLFPAIYSGASPATNLLKFLLVAWHE